MVTHIDRATQTDSLPTHVFHVMARQVKTGKCIYALAKRVFDETTVDLRFEISTGDCFEETKPLLAAFLTKLQSTDSSVEELCWQHVGEVTLSWDDQTREEVLHTSVELRNRVERVMLFAKGNPAWLQPGTNGGAILFAIAKLCTLAFPNLCRDECSYMVDFGVQKFNGDRMFLEGVDRTSLMPK